MTGRPVKCRAERGPARRLHIADTVFRDTADVAPRADGPPMKELLRTNDPVRLSWVQALLRDAGIESLVFDHHTSLMEGSIGAIPRRLMVAERDHPRARALLASAGEEAR